MRDTVLKPKLQQEFERWKVCVLVPVYNHGGTVIRVLEDISTYTTHLLVVNDGSTDGTAGALAASAPACATIVHHDRNKGKGKALITGFRLAEKMGYQRVLTIDADGQHLAKDIPAFIEALETTPDALMIGARDMTQDTVPGGSSFGHKFSNFWYRVITGRKLPDTQSGFRLYPIYKMRKWKLYTGKYELEMEVLVRLSWTNIPVIPIPIEVHYPPGKERITHFRKVPDFTRISLLSVLFLIIGLLVARPLRFFRSLTRARMRELFREHILGAKDSNQKLTLAVMVGLFVGVAPIWGFQIVAVLGFTVLLKLNKVIALAAAHISVPPMIPVILYFSFKLGGVILGRDHGLSVDQFQKNFTFAHVQADVGQYILGSLALGSILAIGAGLIFYVLLLCFRKKGGGETPAEDEQLLQSGLSA